MLIHKLIDPTLNNITEYKYKNYLIEFINNKGAVKTTYDSSKIFLTNYSGKSIKMIFLKILDYDNLASIYKYDTMENKQKTILDAYGLFNIEISNHEDSGNEYFTISIVIKKPNEYKLITSKIKNILDLV